MELRRKLEALGPRLIHTVRGRRVLFRRDAGRGCGGGTMSLATRLSAFFLVAMALVLAGFSGTLYVLARTYLVRELDERLLRSLDTLEASVDIEPGGLEWEPADRQMTLGVEPRDRRRAMGGARRPGRSGGPLGEREYRGFPVGWAPTAWPSNPADGTAFGAVPGWRLAARRLELGELLRRGRGHPDDEPGYEVQYPALVLVVGLAPAPVEATLGWLGLTLSVLSAGVWAAAAVAGRWLCLRALAPLNRMARAATAMTAADLGHRLPAPGTGDELDELGRAFNDLLDRLHEAFLRIHEAHDRHQRFAGDASHQLRTPLAALLGQVQVALRRDRPPKNTSASSSGSAARAPACGRSSSRCSCWPGPEAGRPDLEVVDLARWVPEHLDQWSTHPRAATLGASTIAHRWPCGSTRRCWPSSSTTCWRMPGSTARRGRRSWSGVARGRVDRAGRGGSRPGPDGRGGGSRLRAVLSRRAGASRRSCRGRPGAGRRASDRRHLRRDARSPERTGSG